MGRPSKGWVLRKKRGRPYCVRFTLHGKTVELGTGERNEDRAAAKAAELYADAIRGARRITRRTSASGQPLAEVADRWLTAIASVIDPGTRATCAMYADAHWSQFFPTLESVTESTAADYTRMRLGSVQASTVRKELSALRQLCAWAVEQGTLAEAPLLPSIPRRTLGTVHKQARNGPPVELTPAEAKAILKRLPVRDPRFKFPVRARFVVLYETGLRPSTVERLSVPEHWRPGAAELRIPRSIDKARNGRPVPLTPAAVRALTSAARARGLIFGVHDLRVSLRKAAAKVIDKDRADRLSEQHWRHNRITHWTEESQNMAGIQYLAGHKLVSTTSRYVKPSMRAAQAVITGASRRRPRNS